MKKRMIKDLGLLSLLKSVGLNEYESRVFATLLLQGASTASELSINANVPRPRVYDILEKLASKGLVTKHPGRPVRFKALDIDEAFSNYIEIKRQEHEKNLKEINRLKEKLKNSLQEKVSKSQEFKSEKDMVWVLKNRANIYSKLESLISNANESILIATTEEGLKRKITNYGEALRKARKRGVDIKIISPADDEYARIASKFANFINKDPAQRLVTVDDHVLLFLTPEHDEEVGAWIKSPYFARNVRRLF